MADPQFVPPPAGMFVNSPQPSAFAVSSPAAALDTSFAWRDLFALTKPRLSSQVIFTCGGGLILAPGHIRAVTACLALLATSMVVGAANVLNNYIERDLDRWMHRTRDRALPARRLDGRIALLLAGVLLAFSIPILFWCINPITAILALIALGSYVIVYTPMKQRSPLALWVGAVPGAIPPVMGWTAVRDQIEWPAVAVFAILFCWQIPHFIAIATYQEDDYVRAGHRVLPSTSSNLAVNVHATIWTVLLVLATLWLYPLHVERAGYLISAAALGLGFLGMVLVGFVHKDAERRRAWARRLFRGSLLYLTALVVAMIAGAR